MTDAFSAALAVFVLAAACAGQTVSAAATAGTTFQVSCTAGPLNTLPPGTVMTNGVTLSTQGSSATFTGHATTTFLPLAIGEYEIEATLSTDVAGTSPLLFTNFGAACGVFWLPPLLGRNDVLLRFTAAEPVRGRFFVTYSSYAFRFCTATYWVDVLDDGVAEASNVAMPQPLLPVSFGPGTLDVRMSNYTGFVLSDDFPLEYGDTRLIVRFVPDSRCVATQVAPPCGGLVLAPTQNFTLGSDQIVTGLSTAGQSVAALAYGFQAASTPLPLSAGCLLTNDAFAVRLLLPDTTGRAVHSLHAVPPALRPFSIHAEAVELDFAHNTVTTSASYRIDCQ
ncbi:MAG: hypothetical protein U1E73_11385 [Planctomycetota bacterium]